MSNFIKQPNEKYPISIDYSAVLNESETISSREVIGYLGDTDVTAIIIDSSSISGDDILVVVKAGDAGNTYKITVRATTSDGNVYEKDVEMYVNED